MSTTPISDHALLSDCRSAALVTRDGSVDWLCFPRFDGPSVFGRLLDDDAGHWSIHPVGQATTSRRYIDGTMVLETTFSTGTGTVAPHRRDGHRSRRRGPSPWRLDARTCSCDRWCVRKARSSSRSSSGRGRSMAWSNRSSAPSRAASLRGAAPNGSYSLHPSASNLDPTAPAAKRG